MSRTHAHTPYRVSERRHHSATEVHVGCVHDPSGEGRIVGRRTEHIDHPAHYGTRVFITHGEAPRGARRCDRDGNLRPLTDEGFMDRRSRSYLRCELTDCDGEKGFHEHFFFRLDGFIETYTETRFVPVRETVPCDIDVASYRRGCHVETDDSFRTSGFRYRCHCSWCSIEDAREREDTRDKVYFRRAAAEYNTYGDLESFADDPHRSC